MRDAQVYLQPPDGFVSKVSVAGCYLEKNGKILLLRNSASGKKGGIWAVPGGKLELGETPIQAAIRELKEETGIESSVSNVIDLGALYFRRQGELEFTFHMFQILLDELPNIRLSEEHDDFCWASAQDVESLPLYKGARSAYSRFCTLALPQVKKRMTASVSCYLILEKEGKILLSLRKNTGYYDESWSFPAGHVEMGESASFAMAREAKEEIGIEIDPSNLKPVHIIHRQSNRLNVDIFFHCSSWKGKIENKELDKCEKLQFFSVSDLPKNFMTYNADVLQFIFQGQFYSELGWE